MDIKKNKILYDHKPSQMIFRNLTIIAVFFVLWYAKIEILVKVLIFPNVFWRDVVTFENMTDSTTQIVESKFYIRKSNFNSSYQLLCPKNASGAQEFYGSALTREFYRYIHIQNVYCTPDKMLATQSNLIQLYNIRLFVHNQKETKCGYDHIIYLYSSWGNVFGHFMHDCLSTILKIPKKLLDKSMIMISFDFKTAMQYLPYFNISRKKVIADKRFWYFAKNLYLFYPYEDCFGYMSYTYPKVIELLRKKTGVNSIRGTRYVFINRPPRAWRHVSNMIEFYNLTKQHFPKYPWELLENPSYKNLKNISKEFASFKYVVAPSGSNCVNMLYMNRNYTTGICLIHSKVADYPIYSNVLDSQIWAIGFCNYWGQFEKGTNNCDILFGLYCIKKLLYALTFGKWPKFSYEYMTEAFNFEFLYNLAENNILESRLISINNSKYFYPLNMKIAYGFENAKPIYIN